MACFRKLVLLLFIPLLSSCSEVDVEQARACEHLIAAFEENSATAEIVAREADPEAAGTVIIRYRVAGEEHWVSCRFAGAGLETERLTLEGVATDRKGPLSAIQLQILRRFWLQNLEALAAARGAAAVDREKLLSHLLYFLQQVVNSLTVCAVYGLLAMAYTLVYGIVGRINLAFGELLMIGGYVTLLGVYLFAFAGAAVLPLALVAIAVLAAGFTSLYGWTIERLVFRPLRRSGTQAVLIATIGLAIFLQEYVHLAQGSRERWLQPVLSETHVLASAHGFTLVITTFQALIVLLVACAYLTHLKLVDRSRFGMAWRATAQDGVMATLCGIDAGRTVALTFVLGGAYAGVAGCLLALYSGGVSFYMGTVYGFKALTAAIVGGIGSVPGAMLGGLLIGLLETFWSGYLTIAYRDVVVFGMLAAILVFKPEGLLSRGPGGGREV